MNGDTPWSPEMDGRPRPPSGARQWPAPRRDPGPGNPGQSGAAGHSIDRCAGWSPGAIIEQTSGLTNPSEVNVNLPEKIYTDQDLARAKKKGKIIGWVQGGAIVVGAAFVWNLLGWIPTVIVIGGVAYLGYKLLSKPSKKKKAEAEKDAAA